MTVVAGYGMVLCGHSDDLEHRYRGRIEKVKFGVPIHEAFAHDIPATLLVLMLKVNKEGPLKKDIWRAPGNQSHVRKLSHIMQHGRLVNIANFSVYTAASVIKKFLSKLPGGIFGVENEDLLFATMANNSDEDKQRQVFCRIFCSLPVASQHLLVLLFGTFRMIADSAEPFGTKMTPEAIGISVAPSLFHSCIHEGSKVKLEDVQRFKVASQVVSQIIRSFGHTNLFPSYRVNVLLKRRSYASSNPSAYSMMTSKCAGTSYSLAALHINPSGNLPSADLASLSARAYERDEPTTSQVASSSSRMVLRGGSLHRHVWEKVAMREGNVLTPLPGQSASTRVLYAEAELRDSVSCDF